MKNKKAILGMLTVTAVTLSSQQSIVFAQDMSGEPTAIVAASKEENALKGQQIKAELIQTINQYIAEVQQKANSEKTVSELKKIIGIVESIFDHVVGDSPNYVNGYRQNAKNLYDDFMKTAQDKEIFNVTFNAGEGTFPDGTKEKAFPVEKGKTLKEMGYDISFPMLENEFFEFAYWRLQHDSASFSKEHLLNFPIETNEVFMAEYSLKNSAIVIQFEGDQGVSSTDVIYETRGVRWGDVKERAEQKVKLLPEYEVKSWSDKETGAVLTDDTVLDQYITVMVHTIHKIPGEILNQAPAIHASDRTITEGDIFDALEGVMAEDQEDGKIILTRENVIENNVNTEKAGDYHVTYQVEDSQGASTKKTIKVVVKAKMEDTEEKPDEPKEPEQNKEPEQPKEPEQNKEPEQPKEPEQNKKPDQQKKPEQNKKQETDQKDSKKSNITKVSSDQKRAGAPKTGDTASLGILLSLGAGSSGILSVMLKKLLRKK